MKKKLLSILMCGVLTFTTLVGCSSATGSDISKDEDITLTFMTNKVGKPSEALAEVTKDFTAETGIKVEFSAPGSNYEELMKTKMAANDLPDLWTTHGWSVARYSEYLRPLNDQSWIGDISNSIKPVITNKEDEVFVLPVNMDLAGIIYNVDILNELGVKVEDIKTWDDFEVVLEKAKVGGYIPVHIGGKDSWTIGQFFDWVAPSFYVTNESKNYRKELKDGSFEWELWSEVTNLFKSWNDTGYFNVDSLTSDYSTAVKSLAEGKVVFEFYGNNTIGDALAVNPEVNLGFMPIPSKEKSDEPTLIAGEDIAIGVNKNSKNEEAALKLLNYMAKPEVIEKLATISAMSSGLSTVEIDTGKLKSYYEKNKDVKTMPYFDREFLPNGMWDDMCIGGASILANEQDSVNKAVEQMRQSYNDKINQ